MLCNFCVVDRKMSASLMIVLHYLFTILIIFLGLFNMIEASLLTPSMLAFPRSSIDAYQPLREKEICTNIEVRDGHQFSELEGCQVVEGFLHIALMDNSVFVTDLNNRSFPALREITGYLFFYRVFGLRSIGQLFPNLAVIRGQQLFFYYSFIVYELMQLEEIGLKSLMELQRGSVLIEQNPNLCYVESIDWDRIGYSGRLNHSIQDNKKISECPKCQDSCPADEDGQKLCWNNDECQKVCDHCGQGVSGACSVTTREVGRLSEMRCCHEECAGGCSGGQSNQCDVCKHVIHNGECRPACPPGLYLFMNRRCVSDVECITMLPPRQSAQEYSYINKNWKVFGESGECILECPPGFQEQKRHHNDTLSYFTCIPCQGPCPKVCNGLLVRNIETVQKLRGCTTIDGDLEMQIKGGDNVIQELERNLGSIEVIRGILKITRSILIFSLSFFKSLRTITGNPEPLHSTGSKNFDDEYALIVQNNQHLQHLWPKTQNLTIHKKMLFHFNPRLCLSLIEELVNSSSVPGTSAFKHSDLDISPWSNGDKATCDEQVLNVTIVNKSSFGMLLSWDSCRAMFVDKRQLLGYIISYIEAPYANVSYYEGLDSCGGDDWKKSNVGANIGSDSDQNEIHLITNLQPYTQYAIYVQTYAVASQQMGKRVGARSPILYERTSPAEPGHPEYLRAYSNSSSELVIEWKPPLNPNGIVTHYIVTGQWRKDDLDFDKVNACAEHIIPPIDDNRKQKFIKYESIESNEKLKKMQQLKTEFEDHLYNIYYRDITKKRRMGTATGIGENRTNTYEDNRLVTFYRNVTGTTSTLVGVHHFTRYTIQVVACHDHDPVRNRILCSETAAITSARTKKNDFADDIVGGIVRYESNYTSRSIKIGWNEPEDPNGLVKSYLLEYRRSDDGQVVKECVRQSDFVNSQRTILMTDLLPGNYCVQVRTVSLAGTGELTKEFCFIIEENVTVSYGLGGGFISGVFTFVILVVILWGFGIGYCLVKRKKNRNNHGTVLVNLDHHKYVRKDWEVARDNVVFIREVSRGSFGMVYEGLLRNTVSNQPDVKCAVKMVIPRANVKEHIELLEEENRVMKNLNAHHVVQLLGVVTMNQPMLIIMEFMDNGDLKSFLRSHRPDQEEYASEGRQPLTLEPMLKMAIEIADGMMYLSENKYVNRGLIARDCMVASDLTVKIARFRSTREISEGGYYKMRDEIELLPIQWMAPESLRDAFYTSQSDVWNFGVVLWEIATLASHPHQGLTNEQVFEYVKDGGVLERPEGCPDRLFNLMESCWQFHPNKRPTFIEIIESLLPDVPSKFTSVSYYNSDAGIRARNAQNKKKESQIENLNDLSTKQLACNEIGLLSQNIRHGSYPTLQSDDNLTKV